MYVLHMEMNLFSRYQDVVFNKDGVLRKKSWKYFFFHLLAMFLKLIVEE